MVAIVVTFEVNPERKNDIIPALEGNAAGSRTEPGCLKWEWSRHVDDPLKFAIYELYTDRDAIKAHKSSDHFAQWLKDSEGVIQNKVAGIYEVDGVDPRPVTP